MVTQLFSVEETIFAQRIGKYPVCGRDTLWTDDLIAIIDIQEWVCIGNGSFFFLKKNKSVITAITNPVVLYVSADVYILDVPCLPRWGATTGGLVVGTGYPMAIYSSLLGMLF